VSSDSSSESTSSESSDSSSESTPPPKKAKQETPLKKEKQETKPKKTSPPPKSTSENTLPITTKPTASKSGNTKTDVKPDNKIIKFNTPSETPTILTPIILTPTGKHGKHVFFNDYTDSTPNQQTPPKITSTSPYVSPKDNKYNNTEKEKNT